MSLLAAPARGAADWGALATAFGAAVALLVGVVTVLQKSQADRRAEWWDKARWAVDHAVSSRDDEAEVGHISMSHLIESPAATDDDGRFMRDIAQNIAERGP